MIEEEKELGMMIYAIIPTLGSLEQEDRGYSGIDSKKKW
jgi:hypothetical protein